MIQKKKWIASLGVITAVCAGFAVFTACGGEGGEQHSHTFAEEWSHDETYHWHTATCEHTDEVSEKTVHSFEGDACTVCRYTKPIINVAEGLQEDKTYSVTTLLCGDLRLQLLSDTLVRIESRGPKGFEDRNSYTVVNRDDWGDKVTYTATKTDDALKISTESYTVVLPAKGGAGDVTVQDKRGETIYSYLGLTYTNIWLPSPSDELTSWYFTDSARVIPSDYGYSVSDSNLPLQGWDFDNDSTDIFVFLPDGDYKTFAADFVSLTGQTEMVDLKTFGFWMSRYHKYSDQDYLDMIDTYHEKGYAIDVLVVDTDWRVMGSGGIGYDINTDLFPNMKEFLRQAHEKGANICFNDHPEPVQGTSNILDRNEVAYRNEKLTLLLAMGVDYWWYDRNWGTTVNPFDTSHTRYTAGMYAYQWITQEYLESITDIGEYAKRAIIMANADGCLHGSTNYASDLTAHRYSVQWTGDTYQNQLQKEIETAILAGAELGLPYVGTDVGGHNGTESKELYARWIQYGALSTLFRVHSNGNADIGAPESTTPDGGGRMPWVHGELGEEVFKTYQDMRYRLLPLYYSLAYENRNTGLPIMRRPDIQYPQYAEANRNDEYLLGDYILIAPISEYTGNDTREVFLPEGTWIDVWTGTRYAGPNTITVTHDIKTSPIFVREGALIALAQNMKNVDEKDWSNMALEVYPSANYNAAFTLYEDDGETVAYKDGKLRTTDLAMNCNGNTLKIEIGAAKGSFEGKRAFTERTWNIRLHTNPNWGAIQSIKVNGVAVTPETLAKLTYENGGRPLAFTGGALDGAVNTFSVKTKVNEATTIEIVYESVVNSEKNTAYDATAVNYKVTATKTTDTSVNLTNLGTTDWIAYGYTTAKNCIRKKGGQNLFSDHVATFPDGPQAKQMNLLQDSGFRQTYSNGSVGTPSGRNENAVEIATSFTFSVKTTGAKEKIVLYVGGTQGIAKLNMRDRAGNVKTLLLGSLTEENYIYKVEIDCEAGEASTLYFEYKMQAMRVNPYDSSYYDALYYGLVRLYCGYICES